MIPTLSLDASGFRAAAIRLREVKNVTVKKLIQDQARLFVRDAIKLTPPFGGHAISESFSVQRKVGEKAVARDVGRVFKSKASLKILANPKNPILAAALAKAIQKKDKPAVEAILSNIGTKLSVLVQPDESTHRARRGARGRVRKGQSYLVLDERALKRYTKEKVSHVGKAKAGWLASARALNVPGIPAWITRHGGETPGLIRFEDTPGEYAITVGNLVRWAPDFAGVRIIEAAFENRIRGMTKQAEAILAYELKKAAT